MGRTWLLDFGFWIGICHWSLVSCHWPGRRRISRKGAKYVLLICALAPLRDTPSIRVDPCSSVARSCASSHPRFFVFFVVPIGLATRRLSGWRTTEYGLLFSGPIFFRAVVAIGHSFDSCHSWIFRRFSALRPPSFALRNWTLREDRGVTHARFVACGPGPGHLPRAEKRTPAGAERLLAVGCQPARCCERYTVGSHFVCHVLHWVILLPAANCGWLLVVGWTSCWVLGIDADSPCVSGMHSECRVLF